MSDGSPPAKYQYKPSSEETLRNEILYLDTSTNLLDYAHPFYPSSAEPAKIYGPRYN